ncbi:MAG: hypothetical protein WD934_03600 [Gemmatimonadales bacterium]
MNTGAEGRATLGAAGGVVGTVGAGAPSVRRGAMNGAVTRRVGVGALGGAAGVVGGGTGGATGGGVGAAARADGATAAAVAFAETGMIPAQTPHRARIPVAGTLAGSTR